MATLMRFATKQTSRVLANCRLRVQPKLGRVQPALFISTSKKNKDSIAISDTSVPSATTSKESLADKDENWVSYDYDLYDRDSDEWQNHLITFSICFALCWVTFGFAYFPDLKNQEWYQREAYVELARREKEGLPLIDKNLIAEDKIQLPTEEEVEGVEIII